MAESRDFQTLNQVQSDMSLNCTSNVIPNMFVKGNILILSHAELVSASFVIDPELNSGRQKV